MSECHKCNNERIKDTTKTIAVSKAKGRVLVESPVAKLASHELANEACEIVPESVPESDTDPPFVVPVITGEESLEDFRLPHTIKKNIENQLVQ